MLTRRVGFFLPAWMLGQVLHILSSLDHDYISTKTKFWALMFTMVAVGTCVFSLVQGWYLINGAQKVARQMRREGAQAVLRQVRLLQDLGIFSLADS